MKKVSIYTDGACSGNPGPGGWCAILVYGAHEKEISGSEDDTTNNRMELLAAIEGLKLLKEKCDIDLYSDSSYLVNAFNQGWLDKWISNGWRKTDKTPVRNVESWKALYELNTRHKINWIKIKGHSDNEYNNRCDRSAVGRIKCRKEDSDDFQ
jgi:ribonuclease HI